MKKLLILAVVRLICTANIVAQECNLCGTWSGTYTFPYIGQKKIVLRINKGNTKYRIRVKESNIEGGDTYYYNNCIITSFSENYIKWYVETPMEYDGELNQYIQARMYFSVYFSDGVLLYSDEGRYTDYYNRSKQHIDRIDFPSPPYLRNVELFNEEEGNW